MKKLIAGIGIGIALSALIVGAFCLGRHSRPDTRPETQAELPVEQNPGTDSTENTQKTEPEKPKESVKPITFQADGKKAGEITYTVSASWENGKSISTQIDAVITNQSKEELSGWEVNLDVPAGSKLNQNWNGTMELKGTNLKILPMDYNTSIGAGQTISFGFIIDTPSSYMPKTSKLTIG